MSDTVSRVIIGVVGLTIGLVVGWLVPRSMAPEPAPAPVVVDSPADTEARGTASMVCASSSGGAEALWTRWCEAQLVEQARRAQMVRSEWPSEPGAEAPEAWVDAVERSVERCDLPLTIETVECTEYPCLATIAPDSGMDLDAALRDCAALAEAMPDFEVGTHTTRVRCPDGSHEDVEVLYAYSADTLKQVVGPTVDDGDDYFFESFRVLSRRLDDVVSTHGCGE